MPNGHVTDITYVALFCFSPSPLINTSDKLQMLSPAARRLIRRSTTPGSVKGDKSLRASYNSPLISSGGSFTPNSTPGHTPKSYHHGNNTPQTPSLTDDLLKLN